MDLGVFLGFIVFWVFGFCGLGISGFLGLGVSGLWVLLVLEFLGLVGSLQVWRLGDLVFRCAASGKKLCLQCP